MRFTPHPLERDFLAALEASPEVADRQSGRQVDRVHRVERAVLARLGQAAGYRDEEIKLALDLLEARDLVLLREQSRCSSGRWASIWKAPAHLAAAGDAGSPPARPVRHR